MERLWDKVIPSPLRPHVRERISSGQSRAGATAFGEDSHGSGRKRSGKDDTPAVDGGPDGEGDDCPSAFPGGGHSGKGGGDAPAPYCTLRGLRGEETRRGLAQVPYVRIRLQKPQPLYPAGSMPGMPGDPHREPQIRHPQSFGPLSGSSRLRKGGHRPRLALSGSFLGWRNSNR